MINNTLLNSAFQKDYFKQLLLITSLALMGFLLFSLLGTMLATFLFDIEFGQSFSYNNMKNNEIKALKLIQFFSAIGLFIVPSFVYAKMTTQQPFSELGLIKTISFKEIALVFLIMLTATPFLSLTIALNEAISFPAYLQEIEQWMKQSEQQAMELTKTFLTMNNMVEFLFVFLIVAIIPALGEELLFRGVLQKLLQNWMKKPHLSIWVTAIIFSALHMQFYGFLPRMLLGVLFGYLYYWSNTLWLPILAHLFNNGSVVVASYIYPEKINDTEIVSLSENETTQFLLAILSLIFTVGLLYLFKKQKNINAL